MVKATRIVHWVSGPVPCCDEHAKQLRGLAAFLGGHVAETIPLKEQECTNCKNEGRE